MSTDKYSAMIEAILFYEGDVVKPEKISKITGLSKVKVKEIINKLIIEFQKDIHGIMIVEVADGYSIQLKREVYPDIKEFYNIRPKNRLSKSVITILSIIAYKHPITKSEIEKIRGVSSDNGIRKLLEMNYIEIVGRKDVLGKPLLYGTTKDFLKHFNLKNINDLPKIDELKSDEFNIEE